MEKRQNHAGWYVRFAELLNLRGDTDETGTVTSIRENAVFKSGNAWLLVFAIFTASVGLNVNSTAVIIGAMLISPLMGPIMGAGLALGINDFPLLRRSLRNIGIAVLISVGVSGFYFLLSPITEPQSELLARTYPTVYDVLIAIFGGMTGIVAASRKEKGNAIPGVAIATALMPPLCTAGWSLATMRMQYFAGAMYLFLINSVFICFSTFLFVRFLQFKKSTFLDSAREKFVNRAVTLIAFLVFIPSMVLAWSFLKEASFKSKANRFIESEFVFPNLHIIDREFYFSLSQSKIVLSVLGDTIPPNEIERIKRNLLGYGLSSTQLEVHQVSLTKELEKKLEARTGTAKDDNLARLSAVQKELTNLREAFVLTDQIRKEVESIFPNLDDLYVFTFQNIPQGSTPAATSGNQIQRAVLFRWKRHVSPTETRKLTAFLRQRLGESDLKVWESK